MTRRSSVVAALVAGMAVLALSIVVLAPIDSAGLRLAKLARQAATVTAQADGGAGLADFPLRGRYRSRTFLPGLPAIGAFHPASSLADRDETQLVQLVYDSYSRLSEGPDGAPATFELGGFRTVYRPQLDSIAFYPDLVTLGTDWELATVVRLSGRRAGGAPDVRLAPQWRRVENRAEGGGAALLGRSALEVLALGAKRFPERRRVVALTSYRVRASFRDRAVTYRAAARWLLDGQGDVAFSIADNVVPEVGMAVGNGAAPESFVARAIAEHRAAPPSAEPAAAACVEDVSPMRTERRPRHPQRRNGFSSTPSVEAFFSSHFRCSCDTACASRCEAWIDPEDCRIDRLAGDSGGELRAIATAEALDAMSPAGDREPARCGVGLRCILVDCPDGTCGEVVTRVGAGPFDLHLTTTAAVAGDALSSMIHGCGRCQPVERKR